MEVMTYYLHQQSLRKFCFNNVATIVFVLINHCVCLNDTNVTLV